MALASLLTLLDDIASVLDDVATMTKVAAKNTAGALSDDLALNAEQVSGVRASRELPVVWAVAKGSLRNKAILVPAALLISAVAPWAIIPLLMCGGAYLCFEGFEKLAHKFLAHGADEGAEHAQELKALADPAVDLLALERRKVRGAIRTDFILSAEIVVITLGIVAEASFGVRLGVLSGIALLMTFGVYGLVAAIVKMDDAGLYLNRRGGGFSTWLGRLLLAAAPVLMKLLSVVGTAAMFLVGGGILVHGIGPLHHWIAHWAEGVGAMGGLITMLGNAVVGVVAGAVLVSAFALFQRLRGAPAAH